MFRRKPIRSDFEKEIEQLLGPVQDYARSHGGKIELISATQDGIVTIKLKGACAHCPIAPLTIKHGVKDVFEKTIPGFTQLIVL